MAAKDIKGAASVVAEEGLTTCSICALTSPRAEVFRPNRRRKGLLICPACQQEDERRDVQLWLLGMAALTSLGGLFAVLGKQTNPGWILLNVVLLNLMMWVVIIPHEAGHAIAARVCGLPVIRATMGAGRRLFSVNVFGTTVDFHTFPLGGSVSLLLRNAPWMGTKLFLIFAAGPLVNLGLLLLAIDLGEQAWQAERIESGFAPMCVFIVANFLTVLGNLWPSRSGTHPTDGAHMLALLLQRRPDLTHAEPRSLLLRIHWLYQEGKLDAVVEQSRLALIDYPNDPAFRNMLSAALLGLDRHREALDILESLNAEQLLPWVEASVANNFAWASIMLENDADSARVLSLAERAYELAPWETHITSTLGCAHALYGDAAVAISLLTTRRVMSNPRTTRASSMSGLALAYFRIWTNRGDSGLPERVGEDGEGLPVPTHRAAAAFERVACFGISGQCRTCCRVARNAAQDRRLKGYTMFLQPSSECVCGSPNHHSGFTTF
jgi:hypothetical protein